MDKEEFYRVLEKIKEDEIPLLASFMQVSIPTIKRWKEKKSIPHECMIPSTVRAIKKFLAL